MSNASSYDKETGFYRETPTSNLDAEFSESQQTVQQQDLVVVPWDDDNFSLCLDTFPSSRLARTKYNQYPTTASPLRKHWRSSSSSCSSEQTNADGEEDMIRAFNLTPLPAGLVEMEAKSTFGKRKTTSTTVQRVASNRDAVAGGVFPYKNNGNFLTRINFEKKPTKMITHQQPIHRSNSNNTNRIEHISPLSNSSILLQNENDIFNQPPSSPRPSLMSHKLSNVSIKSKFSGHSALAFPTAPVHRHQQDHFSSNDSQFSENQYSDSGEGWRFAQKKYSSSAIVLMPSTPPMSHHVAAVHQVTLSRTPSSIQYKKQDDYSPNEMYSRNLNERCSPLQHSNSFGSLASFYTPQASRAHSVVSHGGNASVSSYRSTPVTRNADKLVLYLDDGSSLHYASSNNVKNRDSTYSQAFDPAYNGKRKKPRRNKKTSVGIFAKLINNLKQHFIKSTTKQ